MAVCASDLESEAKQQISVFGKNLKGALQQGMKSAGIEGAIASCNIHAPEISQAARAQGWTVGRTSLKTRNAANSPDTWERSVLQSFEERLAAGEPIQSLQASTTENGHYRYMKAIPTGQLCLNCHGTDIAPEMLERLDELYPEDKARGYTEGQIRGAFSVSKALDE
jgi:hypothetical protein